MKKQFGRFADCVTRFTGSPYSFIIAVLIVLIWAAFGPVCHYSDTWQLVINTGTTVVTFLMVFNIQMSQNKSEMAIQLKLNELIRAVQEADNNMSQIEDLTEEELEMIKQKRADRNKEATR